MTDRMFEDKQHASLYQKYRFDPPDEVKELILQYLDKKVGPVMVILLYILSWAQESVCPFCARQLNVGLLTPKYQ